MQPPCNIQYKANQYYAKLAETMGTQYEENDQTIEKTEFDFWDGEELSYFSRDTKYIPEGSSLIGMKVGFNNEDIIDYLDFVIGPTETDAPAD